MPPPRVARDAVLVALAALVLYVGTAVAVQAVTHRPAPPGKAYFNYLADAFLHGRLYLVEPPHTDDLTEHARHWYVPFPPLAALLLMPWVALVGPAAVNTALFSCLCGAATVGLVYATLARAAAAGLSHTRRGDHLWLTAMFACGSVFWYVAVDGQVWFLAQTTAVLMIALAAWLTLRTGNAWLAGTALALAMLSRPHVALLGPLLVGLRVQRGPTLGRGALLRWAAQATLPLVLAAGLLLAYNAARFGHPLDFGYVTQNVAREVRKPLVAHGQFSVFHAWKSVEAMLLHLPEIDPTTGWPVPSDQGLSIFITTPALVLLVRATGRQPAIRGAWLALGLVLVPLLSYYNTGWAQFGYRFSLDFMVPATLLVAAGARGRADLNLRILTVLGVLVNLWGTAWWFKLWPLTG